ncbi:hypothetical protein T11_1192, partial [Trichinella zimbabwensis]
LKSRFSRKFSEKSFSHFSGRIEHDLGAQRAIFVKIF